jgi:multimeric flavodoxin WrbA
MKSLIDRCGMVSRVNGFTLKNKLGAAIVAMRRAGGNHVFSSLNYFFLISQMIVVGADYWNIGKGLKEGDVNHDNEGMQTLQILADNFSRLLTKLQS